MSWGAARGAMTDAERYSFDLQGFLVRRGALSGGEVRTLRAAVAELGVGPPSASLHSQRFNGHLTRHAAFRDLIDHPAVLDVVIELCGPNVRLDHAYGIVMAPRSSGLGLHGGGTPHDPSQYYAVHGGRMHNGLVGVQWALVDHRVGDGGFGCIPGSHKANFPLPPDHDQRLVTEVPMAAGDVVIFTEALTHCTIPWRGKGERQTLIFKYSPGHLAWGPDYEELQSLVPLLTPQQQRLLQKPSVHAHRPVRERG
ncbi:MAG: phytanoyl-CoA dioxygenase family protein [Acidimicrobiia bacterium]